MKNRIWFALIVLLSIAVIVPVFAQTGETATEEEALSPGEESTGTTTTESTTTETSSEGSSTLARLWVDPETGTIYANSAQKFELKPKSNPENVAYTEYKIDGNNFQKYTGPFNISEEGAHTIVYRSVDKAGNVEVDRVYNVVIDNTPPSVQIIPAKPFITKNGRTYTSPGNTFTIRASDNYSGVKKDGVQYNVNGKELKPYDGSAIQLTEGGSQLIQYVAEDNLGNKVEGGSSMLVNVDAEKPRIEIKPTEQLVQVGDSKYAKRTTGFNVEGLDSGSGVEQVLVKIDDSQEWQTYTDTIYFTDEKQHSIQAKAVDSVGNESDVVKLDFMVKVNPPTTEIQPVK